MKFSRHTNEQYNWANRYQARLVECLRMAETGKMTQADYLARCAEITETRLTSYYEGRVFGYLDALRSEQMRRLHHVRRLVNRPETATTAKWDEMTEEMRQACRGIEGATETCLAWDVKGEHPYGDWR